MKVTARNKTGCPVAHNDRNFEITQDSHIDISRTMYNTYGNIYHDDDLSFKEVELQYYQEHYSDKLKALNDSAIKHRRRDRIQNMNQYMHKHGPEELLLQIGGKDDYIDPTLFDVCVKEFLGEMEKYSSNCHILDFAIHLDEKTPHAHIRKVWDYTNEDGILEVSKDKALKELGFEPPCSNQPEGRYNNRAIAFDKMCREKWTQIAEEHGFILEKTTERQFNPEREDMNIGDFKKEMEKEDLELVRERASSVQEMEKEYEERRTELERRQKELDAKEKEIEKQEEQNRQRVANIAMSVTALMDELKVLEDKVAERERKLKELKVAKNKELKDISKLPSKSQRNLERATGEMIERDMEIAD